MHPIGIELKTSTSTLLLWGKEMPCALELIGTIIYLLTKSISLFLKKNYCISFIYSIHGGWRSLIFNNYLSKCSDIVTIRCFHSTLVHTNLSYILWKIQTCFMIKPLEGKHQIIFFPLISLKKLVHHHKKK